MCIEAVNAACINRPFTTSTIAGMAAGDPPHPSMTRLLRFAIEATADKRRKVSDWASLGDALDVSPQVMTNWKRRGISVEGALAAEAAFGCSGAWVLSGKHPPAPAGVAGHLTAQEPRPAWPEHHAVTASDWALLQDIKVLPDEERDTFTRDLQARATKYRSYVQEVLKRHGSNGQPVPDDQVREHLPPVPSKK